MNTPRISWLASAVLVLAIPRYADAIDVVQSANGGPTANTLALNIADGITIIVNTGSANTTINSGGSPASNARAMGTFINGDNSENVLLPQINRLASESYSGGIGISSGVCLCTGIVTDNDPGVTVTIPNGRGVGVEGPNNGDSADPFGADPRNEGEVSFDLDFDLNRNATTDADFNALVQNVNQSADATVLQFQFTLTKPAIPHVSYVFWLG